MDNGMGYSPKSAIDRQISDGRKYDKYFPKHESKVVLLKKDGEVEDTVQFMKRVVRDYSFQTRKIASVLAAYNTDDSLDIYNTVRNVYDFVCKYIKYNIEPGEQLQTPAHTWHQAQVMARKYPNEKKYSADCDCMAIFCACIFKNLQIPNVNFKIAGYTPFSYQHVYVTVKHNGKTIICDPVYWAFDDEKEPVIQKEYMALSGTDILLLAGIDGNSQKPLPNLPISNVYVEQQDGTLGVLSGKRKEKRKAKKAEQQQKKAARKEGKKEKKQAKKEIKAAKKSGDKKALEAAKQKKQKAKEKINENRTGIAKVAAKVGKAVKNSTLVVARGPFLLLMRMNFRGMAAKLANNKAAYDKFLRIWKNIGGKQRKLDKAIEKGKGKKAMFGSKKTVGSLSGTLAEIGEVMQDYGMISQRGLLGLMGASGLGVEPTTMSVGAAMAAAAPIIAKVIAALKEVGENLPESGDEEEEPGSDGGYDSQDYDSYEDDGEYYDEYDDGTYYDDGDGYYEEDDEYYDDDDEYYDDYDDDMDGLGYFFIGDTIEPDGTLGKGWFRRVWQNGRQSTQKLLRKARKASEALPDMEDGIGTLNGKKKKKQKTPKAKKTKTSKTERKAKRKAKKQTKKAEKQNRKTAKKQKATAKKQQKQTQKQQRKTQRQTRRTTSKAKRTERREQRRANGGAIRNMMQKADNAVSKVANSKPMQTAMQVMDARNGRGYDSSNNDDFDTITYETMDNTTSKLTTNSTPEGETWLQRNKKTLITTGVVLGCAALGFLIYKAVSDSGSASISGLGYIEPKKLS